MSEGTREVCYRCAGLTGGCDGRCRPDSVAQGLPLGPPKGCICPPTSEQTCQRWDCGRKSPALKVT